MKLPPEFISLSQEIGAQPLLVQGPGGNTSVKIEGHMWIKASGTELAEARDKNIFVAVDPAKAMQELEGAGDGSCRSALINPDGGLRPSIETTFHAMFNHKFVFHFHSVAAILYESDFIFIYRFLPSKMRVLGFRRGKTPPGLSWSRAAVVKYEVFEGSQSVAKRVLFCP